ncbi:MAG: hypothetical protein QMB63_03095 [Clostridiaceae bacterium]
MRRTKLVQVTKGGISIEERIKNALEQYSITDESLIDIRISESEEGRTTALIIYDPDKRNVP